MHDDILIGHAEESVQPGTPSLGAVTGELFRYNHLELTAGIKDQLRGEQVTVRFHERMDRRVRELLTSTVRVWGEVHRNAVGKRTMVIADHIDPVGHSGQPVAVDDLVGLFVPDARPGVDPVAWQREQRDG